MSHKVTLPKYTDTTPNEDSCIAIDDLIAISDGAGGCGVFASDWSKYLIDKIPHKPITSFEEFDNWIDSIWEPFYNKHEEIAKEYDGIFQKKFYTEGSCATIAVVWRLRFDYCYYIAYGDSVVFHYNKTSGKLEHSFTKLADFSNPPHLISCKDPLQEEGFKKGEFVLENDSVVFAASDAISHFVLMMYMVSHSDKYEEDINEIISSKSSDATMLSLALKLANQKEISFDVLINDILNWCDNQEKFQKDIVALNRKGLIDIDDYTIVKFD